NTLVLCDVAARLEANHALTLPYNPHTTAQLQEDSITDFRFGEQVRPTDVVLKDYTFKHPNWAAQAEKEAHADDSRYQRLGYEHFDYPGRYKASHVGLDYATYRLDQLRRDAHQGQGRSNSAQLCCGQLLSLTHHPHLPWNTLWQVTEVICRGEQAQALEEEAQHTNQSTGTYLTTQFKVIPKNQNYRANVPQKPQIYAQTATVTGPAGEEIYTDNYGRVKVQFHWDRAGKQDDHSSCWIRVAHPWAGQGWGMLALPRIGQEVVVDFLDGDPDQPVITHRVYNALQIPPGNLPHTMTQMHIRSKTYKGNGYNSIMFDDATNDELFHQHAERDMETVVKHDQRNFIKNHRTLDVDGSQTTTIGRGRTTTIETGNDIKTVLAGNNMETIALLKSILAKEIFQFANDRIELEVG
ncbi:type VI secretion system tip protein TssI/VgrG, partial [Conservatibacter flavescens]